MQVTWPLAVRRIDGALEIRASIAWTRGPPITIKARALNGGIITVVMKRRGAHLDCPITRSKGRDQTRFITHLNSRIQMLHPRSDGHNIFEMVHRGPFHRNRRSFRWDGYAQNVYKTRYSSDVQTIRVGNQSN